MSSNTSRKYTPELRERAVRMVAEVRPDYPSEWAAIESVATKLGIGTAQTLLSWVRREQVDSGRRGGVSSDMATEMRKLRKLRAENKELRRANSILKSGGCRTNRWSLPRFIALLLSMSIVTWVPLSKGECVIACSLDHDFRGPRVGIARDLPVGDRR
jgi:transposase